MHARGRPSMFAGALFAPALVLAQGTPGQITKFGPDGLTPVDSIVREDDAGNIGIGTTSPAAKLDISDGNLNLENSTATKGSILKEGVPFIHNFGLANTFVGNNAGNLEMSGYANSAFGALALQSNTTGFLNTAIGDLALQRNTSGFSNTAIGSSALSANTTGGTNTATGEGALLLNTEGSSNTAQGFSALRLNSTGSSNAASGANALHYNTVGSGNAAHGVWALGDNTTGSDNTATGLEALTHNMAGSNNTAAGIRALYANLTGSDNTAVGNFALRNNSAGSFNTAIGSGADLPFGSELTNATAIGAGAIVDASNKIRLGNTEVEVIEGQVPYTFSSDKTRKENFKPLDGEEVLTKLRGLNVSSWNYIGQDAKQRRHYGAMAQDFFAAFGNDGVGMVGTATTINSGDMAGLTLAAAQALERRTAEQGNQLDALRLEKAELRARLETLERAVRACDQRTSIADVLDR